MTAAEKESTFNIFQILSAGDKELVHSSMLKFLIEESSSFHKEFLGKEFENLTEISIKLEVSDKVSDNSRNKRLRFDLLGYHKPKDAKLLFAIENKFKATPSIHQLDLYNKYFDENKNKLHSKFTKHLIVFSEEQIPSDVRNYCKESIPEWEILSFFSFEQKKPNLLNFLQNQTFEPCLQNSKKILIKEYKEYLESIHKTLNYYIDSEYYYPYYKILEKETENPIFAPRFIGFQYLLHIQALISKSDLIKNWIDDSQIKMYSSNDGGKNIIPSINFKIEEDIDFKHKKIRAAYFGIDGPSIKISVYYIRDKKENKEEIKQYLKDIQESILPYAKKLNNIELKQENGRNIKLKESEDNTNIGSVFSLLTFEAKNDKLKKDVVNDCANLLNMYFKYFTQ